MSEEDQYDIIKQAILDHMREIFEELEESMVRNHEEKFAMLEDALHNASDVEELQVAFSQWHAEHSDDLELEYEIEDLWQAALDKAEMNL